MEWRKFGDTICLSPAYYYENPVTWEYHDAKGTTDQLLNHIAFCDKLGFNTLRFCIDVINKDEKGYFYSTPNDKDGYFINHAMIATQNDKLVDALNAFNDLFDNMPEAQANFDLAKESMLSLCRTKRTTKMGIINAYLNYEKMGYDMKKTRYKILFDAYPKVTMQDIVNFNHKYIKGQKKVYMALGKEADMDFNALAKFGKVKKLTLKDVFGY